MSPKKNLGLSKFDPIAKKNNFHLLRNFSRSDSQIVKAKKKKIPVPPKEFFSKFNGYHHGVPQKFLF